MSYMTGGEMQVSKRTCSINQNTPIFRRNSPSDWMHYSDIMPIPNMTFGKVAVRKHIY